MRIVIIIGIGPPEVTTNRVLYSPTGKEYLLI